MKFKLKDTKKLFSTYWQEIALLIGVVLYSVYFTYASFQRFINYYTGRFDLGNMDQTVWNTLHGNIFQFTDPNGTQEISRLAVHADFILILLSPLYLVWSDPRMLLLIQTIVLALGAIFIFLIAKKLLKNKTISLVFAIAYLLNPMVQFVNLYDFHAVALATTLLLAGFYFILEKKWWLVILFLFLAGITKEQVWAINTLLGIYIIIFSKEKLVGSLISLFSIFSFIFLFWIAIPNASIGSQHFALSFFDKYGSSPHEVIKNIILNPIEVFKDITTPEKQEYLKQLFRPLGYLSIIGFPYLIFAAPDLAINLLSSSVPMQQIWYQYTSTITPFIFIAAIYGAKFLHKKIPAVKYWYIGVVILFFTYTSANTYGPLWFSEDANLGWHKKPLENREVISNYLSSIPLDAKVSASNTIGSHMSQRPSIFVIPKGINESDYVIFLIRSKWGKEYETYLEIKDDENFELSFQDNNFFVFEKVDQ